MNRLIISIIVFFMAMAAMAQTDMMRISYAHHAKVYKDKSKERIDKYILHTNFKNSTYYNPSAYFFDKSAHDENARNAYGQMASAMEASGQGGMVPTRTVSTYVFKTFDNQSLRVYQDSNEEYIYYDEPFDEMKWELVGDSTKTVLNYECMMAETDYHGRHWTVWFTPEIPIQDGPWKLQGLPGLIMNAEAGDGFIIEVKEIGYTRQAVPEVYSEKEYAKGERKLILADHEHYENNFESMMAAQGIKLNADGSQAELPKYDRQRRAWETDY